MAFTVRIYDTEQKARDAVAKVQHEDTDITPESILVLAPAIGTEAAVVSEAIRDGRLPGRYVNAAADGLRRGRWVVAINLLFNPGQPVEDILDSFGPVDSDQLPAYMPTNPAPFSDFFGFPVLTQRRSSARLIPGSSVTFGSFLGLSLLSKKATPLSSMFGLKLLSARPRTSSFGLPLLSSKPTPLSSMFGLKTLTAPKRR